jgi:polyvinyl alcohol dehydrogenase (cytochrome)
MKRIGTLAALAAILVALALLGASCGKGKVWTPDTRNAYADPLALKSGANLNGYKVLWKTPTTGFITGRPIVRTGAVYFGDWSGAVYAVSSGSGLILWSKNIEQVSPVWAWRGFSGTGTMSEDMLFMASAEGNLYAIDPKGGAVKWQRGFTDKPYSGNTGTLLYCDKIVYVPVSSMSEAMDQQEGFTTDFQGAVVAFDAVTGKQLWEFKTVTGDGNGCGVWSGLAADPVAGLLYFTTGNNYTGAATEMSDAIVALDLKTGAKKWVKQATPNDVWTMAQPKGPDYDFGAPPQLVDATVNGAARKLVIAGQKSGVLWALDRLTGEVVWTDTLGTGGVGGGFLAGTSIDDTGIYAWANNDFAYAAPDSHLIDVAAFEPGTGKVLWKKLHAQPAAVTTAGFLTGGFYFVGSLDGLIRAYNTKSGDVAWTSEPMGSISTSIVVANDRFYFGTGIPSEFGGSANAGALHCVGLPKK